MKKVEVEKLVETLINPILQNEKFELIDIEFTKEGPHRYLRVFIDKIGGITLDDCQKVSEQLSEKLDEEDPIEENYFLEISSPGLDRPLKKTKDFERFKGENIEVRLYQPMDNKKVFEGELVGSDNNVITIKIDNKNLVEIPREKIAITKLAIKF